MLEQSIREREQQLDESIKIRTTFQQKIENYRVEEASSLSPCPPPIEEGTLVRFMDFDVYRGLNWNLFLHKIYHWFFSEISDRKNS